nr:hypothetical protein [Arthrobacter sp. FW305-BF8]
MSAEHSHGDPAHLRPTGAAQIAHGASAVVVHHDTIPHRRHSWIDADPYGLDYTRRLVAGDTRSHGVLGPGSVTIEVQVTATHSRRADRYDDFTRSWFGIRELVKLDCTVTHEYCT